MEFILDKLPKAIYPRFVENNIMEFTLDQGQATYRIESYVPGLKTLGAIKTPVGIKTSGYVKISGLEYRESIVVMPESLIFPWRPKTLEELTPEDFELILEKSPELVLFGSGAHQSFINPSLYQSLTRKKIGVEVMHTLAACRTYTILMAEGRNIAAALLL